MPLIRPYFLFNKSGNNYYLVRDLTGTNERIRKFYIQTVDQTSSFKAIWIRTALLSITDAKPGCKVTD